jgi:hypothetical protein
LRGFHPASDSNAVEIALLNKRRTWEGLRQSRK